MATKKDERTLVLQFRDAKLLKDQTEEAAKKASKAFEDVESELIEAMEAQGVDATARYEGVGYVRLKTPRLYASCKKENEEALFEFLKKQKRADLIKPTVHSASLSSFVGEVINEGKVPLPDFISYYMKKSAQLY